MDANSSPSPALLDANRELHRLRTQVQAHRPTVLSKLAPAGDLPTAEKIAQLPAHLGWSSQALTTALRRQPKMQAEACRLDSAPMPTKSVLETAVIPQPHPEIVKAYPTILTAFLKHELAAPGRIYLLLKAMDTDGRGWLYVNDVRQRLTRKASSWRVCGWRRLRQILQQGRGVMWERDDNGRIWLYSPARIALVLDCGRLRGKPVQLPTPALLGGIQEARAHFYASFHSGRRKSNPISRETLTAVTGATDVTQRTYEKVAGVKAQQNIAVGEAYTQEAAEVRSWRQGTAVFDFIDHHGRQGPAKRHYVAWQLPNSYTGCHQPATKGRQKKLNRQIDLVTQQARGNDLQARLFYPTGATAARATNRSQGAYDRYWPGECGQRNGERLWHTLSALGGV